MHVKNIPKKPSRKRVLRFCIALIFPFWLAGIAVSEGAPVSTVTFTTDTATDGVFIRPNDAVGDMADRGALHVSGRAAVNLLGEAQGPSVTFIRFNVCDTVAEIEQMCREADKYWAICGVNLALTECRLPNNQRFNRGQGQFHVTWTHDDSWDECTLTWANKDRYLSDPNTVTIGTFPNAGLGDQYIPRQRLPLDMPAIVVDDLLHDSIITLYLSPADEDIGFVFNSDDITTERIHPYLEIEVLISDDVIDPCRVTIERSGAIAGDLNRDCRVDLSDFLIFAENWLTAM